MNDWTYIIVMVIFIALMVVFHEFLKPKIKDYDYEDLYRMAEKPYVSAKEEQDWNP